MALSSGLTDLAVLAADLESTDLFRGKLHLQVVDNRTCEASCVRVSLHIRRSNLAIIDDLVDRACDGVGMMIETQMAQHHSRRENHGSRIGDILALDILSDVSASGLEQGEFLQ